MIEVPIPGCEPLRLASLLLDMNGTLSVDGRVAPAVLERLRRLAGQLRVVVATADTFGTARQALALEGGATHAWRFDPGSSTVRRTPITVGNVAGNEVVVTSGLRSGDIVVTAGAHQLKEGQKVRLLAGAEAPPVPAGQTIVKPDGKTKG